MPINHMPKKKSKQTPSDLITHFSVRSVVTENTLSAECDGDLKVELSGDEVGREVVETPSLRIS